MAKYHDDEKKKLDPVNLAMLQFMHIAYCLLLNSLTLSFAISFHFHPSSCSCSF
jgi:hypothetical protein